MHTILFITFDFFVANVWPEHCREIGFRFLIYCRLPGEPGVFIIIVPRKMRRL